MFDLIVQAIANVPKPETNWTDVAIQLATIIAAIAALGTFVLKWTKSRRESQEERMRNVAQSVSEMHKQVTENHHDNETPTIHDRLDTLDNSVNKMGNEVQKTRQDIRSVQNDLSEHEVKSEKQILDVIEQASEKGIHLRFPKIRNHKNESDH